MSLLEQRVDVEAAAARAAALARRARELFVAAALFAAAGVSAAVVGHGQVAASLLIAAAVGAALAGFARGDRDKLLTHVLAQGDGDRIDAARRFGALLLTLPRRRRLAEGLERAADVGRAGLHDYTHARPDRALAMRDELLRLAAAFRDEAVAIAPASAALCRRMLCEAAVSPLYNPRLGDEELPRVLRAIAAGIKTRRG